jgi:hypothetical protein
VSLFYPATLQMTMAMGGIKVTGTIPPDWMIPEDARDSVAISKLNVKAVDGTTAWPVSSHPFHPEDKGVALTDDERQMMIRTADMGGQYWSRQNTGFVAYSSDPTGPGQKY